MPIKLLDDIVSGPGTPVVPTDTVYGQQASTLTAELTNLNASILNWKFNNAVTDTTDPGSTFLALNNAAKASATIITFNTTANTGSARFDELLAALDEGDFIFLQQRNATSAGALYQATGRGVTTGTKVDVTVTLVRSQGAEFGSDAVLNVIFVPKSAFVLNELTKTGDVYNFSSDVQVLDRNLTNVTIPVNAPYDVVARFLFGGASIETAEGADRVEYTQGYSRGVDYRDNGEGTINDATHYVDTAAGVTIGSNLASSLITYPAGTTFQRLIAVKLQLNPGNMGTGAMLVLISDPGSSEREFMHITTDNKIEIDQDPESETGTHATVSSGAGDVVIDDGSWLILEMVPSSNGIANNFDVIPAVLKADGTRIECNDIIVDLSNISTTFLGISRSANQRGQILEYKTIQLPGYLRHDRLNDLFDHVSDKWCFGYARLFESAGARTLNIVSRLRGPVLSTLMSRDITATAIGGTGDSVLTLPADYTDFETVMYTVVEDGGQTTNHHFMTRWLEANATLSTVRISGNDTATWNRTARTMTLDTTSDTWEVAVLAIPRLT